MSDDILNSLQDQIENMKCCGNCMYNFSSSPKCEEVYPSANQVHNDDYSADELCSNWKYDDKTIEERLQ